MDSPRLLRLYFRWIGPLVVVGGLFIVAAVLILAVLPNATLQNLVMAVAPIFSKGGIRNVASVIDNFRKALPLVGFMGIAFVIFGLLLAFLTRFLLRRLSQETTPVAVVSRPSLPLSRSDLLLVAQIVFFLFLTLPAMSRSLDYDEAWTMRYVDGSWLNILAPNESNNHVFSTFLIKISVTLFGGNEIAIRLPALLAGIALIVGMYFLAKAVSQSLLAANAAALLSATSYSILFTSVSARGYAIVMAAAVWLGFLLLQLPSASRRLTYTLYVVIGTIAITTLPTAVVIVAAFMLAVAYWLWRREISASLVLHILHLTLLIAVLSLVVYAWSLPDRLIWMGGRRPLLTNVPTFILTKIFSAWALQPGAALAGLLVLLMSVAGLILVWQRSRALAVYVGIAIFGAMAVHISGALDPFWYSAVGLVLVPFLLAECLYGLYSYRHNIAPRVLAVAAVAIIVAVNVTTMPTRWTPAAAIDDVALALKEAQTADSASVAVVHLVPQLEYYFGRDKLKFQDYSELPLDNSIQNYDVIVYYGTASAAPALVNSDGRLSLTTGIRGDVVTLFYRPALASTFAKLSTGSS